MENSKMPSLKVNDIEGSEELLPSNSEVFTGSDSSVLETPVNISDKPIIDVPDHKSSSNVIAPSTAKHGIEVVALRKGFHNQRRLVEGDRFTIAHFDDLGEWMKCVDLDIEKKHQEFLKKVKAKK